MKELVGPIVRAILQVAAGILITKGMLNAQEAGAATEALVGAAVSLASVYWSAKEKQKIKAGLPTTPPAASLALLLIPALALLGPIGCSSTPKSPERIAITAVSSSVQTADAAIAAWADYVVLKRQEIEKLKQTDRGAAMDAANELLKKEGRVSIAYYNYQEAAKAAITLGATSASPGDVSSKLAAASSQLIAIIASFTTR